MFKCSNNFDSLLRCTNVVDIEGNLTNYGHFQLKFQRWVVKKNTSVSSNYWAISVYAGQFGNASGLTMARWMGCCLMAPRHYLKHCWEEHVSIDSPFKFTNVSVGEVKSLLWNINSSKETGNEFAQPFFSLVNMSLSLSCIPHELKKSETSLYTGQNNLEPQNYRPLVCPKFWTGL